MPTTDQNVTFAAGDLITLTSGSYDDFCIVATVRARRALDLRQLVREYVTATHPDPTGPFDHDVFVGWVELQGAWVDVSAREVSLGDGPGCYPDWSPITRRHPPPRKPRPGDFAVSTSMGHERPHVDEAALTAIWEKQKAEYEVASREPWP